MTITSLELKAIVGDSLDLFSPTFIPVGTVPVGEYTVESGQECRIDKIAIDVYGGDEYSDIIKKFNGIKDPFSIKEGDVLLIPELGRAKTYFKRADNLNDKSNNEVAKQFSLDNEKASRKDKRRLEYLKKLSSNRINGSKENLPPNVLKNDESNVKDNNDGTITLG